MEQLAPKLIIGKIIFAEADYDLLFQFYLVIVGVLFIAFIIRTDFFIEKDIYVPEKPIIPPVVPKRKLIHIFTSTYMQSLLNIFLFVQLMIILFHQLHQLHQLRPLLLPLRQKSITNPLPHVVAPLT